MPLPSRYHLLTMLHLLGQTGAGGWFTPGMVKAIFWVIVVVVSVLGPLIKKANEARVKRQAEQGQRRREEEALRTGRPLVDNSDTGEFEAIKATAPSQSAKQATAEDARRKLQELAERRRRELAEMMRRAQGGSGSNAPAPQAASRPAPTLPTPPRMAPPSAPMPRPRQQPQQPKQKQQRPQQPQPRRSPNPQQPARSMQEVEARRKGDAQAQREGANLSASRERAEEAETTRREAIAKLAKGAAGGGVSKNDSAYDLPGTRRADSMSAAVSGASVGAAMARVGAGGKTASAAEWRKAIVLSELLNKPVGMREEGERVF